MQGHPIRVLIVDDSLVVRRILAQLIAGGRDMEVVGQAANGREALARIRQLKPDVVTLDLEMPEMNGLQVLETIMSSAPLPVIIVSSQSRQGADITLRCLEIGAVDFITVPAGDKTMGLAGMRYLIWQKIRNAAQAHVNAGMPVHALSGVPHRPHTSHAVARRLVAIGASTGGPRTLLEVLELLPAELAATVVVVQHMPAYFTAAMAARFNQHCALEIKEAEEGDCLEEGSVFIAPGGKHLYIAADRSIRLTEEPPIWGVRPAVDPMMESAADIFGSACLGIILTGMGRDGTAGLTTIKRRGGRTLGQDASSCVVYGMPRAAYEAGVVDCVSPPAEMAREVIRWCQGTLVPV